MVYHDELDGFYDRDLIEELKNRGYKVYKNELEEVVDWYKRGNVKEALIQLEKVEPQLFGISEKVK
jgi:hypothetical protein